MRALTAVCTAIQNVHGQYYRYGTIANTICKYLIHFSANNNKLIYFNLTLTDLVVSDISIMTSTMKF